MKYRHTVAAGLIYDVSKLSVVFAAVSVVVELHRGLGSSSTMQGVKAVNVSVHSS